MKQRLRSTNEQLAKQLREVLSVAESYVIVAQPLARGKAPTGFFFQNERKKTSYLTKLYIYTEDEGSMCKWQIRQNWN